MKIEFEGSPEQVAFDMVLFVNRFTQAYCEPPTTKAEEPVINEPPTTKAEEPVINEPPTTKAEEPVINEPNAKIKVETPPKQKRKRRTKAEMEAARAAEQGGSDEKNDDSPADDRGVGTSRRRRNRDDAVEGEGNTSRRRGNGISATSDDSADGEAKGRRSKRRTPKANTRDDKAPEENGITDIDAMKAASEAAAVITPKAVTAILDQFGVSVVNDLSQDQRKEFLNLLDDAVEDVKG